MAASRRSRAMPRPQRPRDTKLFGLLGLTFLQISGRKFLPELFGEAHPKIAPLQALCWALYSTNQSTPRAGEKGKKVPRRGVEEGWPAIGNREWGGFQEGGFQIVERAAFSSRGNLLLQWNSYLKSTLRLLLRRRV